MRPMSIEKILDSCGSECGSLTPSTALNIRLPSEVRRKGEGVLLMVVMPTFPFDFAPWMSIVSGTSPTGWTCSSSPDALFTSGSLYKNRVEGKLTELLPLLGNSAEYSVGWSGSWSSDLDGIGLVDSVYDSLPRANPEPSIASLAICRPGDPW